MTDLFARKDGSADTPIYKYLDSDIQMQLLVANTLSIIWNYLTSLDLNNHETPNPSHTHCPDVTISKSEQNKGMYTFL